MQPFEEYQLVKCIVVSDPAQGSILWISSAVMISKYISHYNNIIYFSLDIRLSKAKSSKPQILFLFGLKEMHAL